MAGFVRRMLKYAVVLSALFVPALLSASGGGGYEIDAMQVLRSSWIIVLMFFLSIVVVGVSIERFFYFKKTHLDSEKFLDKLKSFVVDSDFKGAAEYCKKSKGSIPKVILTGIENKDLPREEVDHLMEVTRMEERINMERYLQILGTLGNTVPFMGLLGTVIGIIKAFKDLAGSAGAGPEVVMVGIAEALIATAVGLGVAIPAVIMFNYFSKKVKVLAVEMEAIAKKYLVYVANYGGKDASRKR